MRKLVMIFLATSVTLTACADSTGPKATAKSDFTVEFDTASIVIPMELRGGWSAGLGTAIVTGPTRLPSSYQPQFSIENPKLVVVTGFEWRRIDDYSSVTGWPRTTFEISISQKPLTVGTSRVSVFLPSDSTKRKILSMIIR